MFLFVVLEFVKAAYLSARVVDTRHAALERKKPIVSKRVTIPSVGLGTCEPNARLRAKALVTLRTSCRFFDKAKKHTKPTKMHRAPLVTSFCLI